MRDKYYRVVKSLVEYLGNKMPPKPHKQAAIHALMLQHWDRVRTAQITPKLVSALQASVLLPTLATCSLASKEALHPTGSDMLTPGLSIVQIAYPCKRTRRAGHQQISVGGSLPGTEGQHLQAAVSKPEHATLESHPSVAGCSPGASAAVRATVCGGATTGSAGQLQQGSAAAQQRDQLCGQLVAPILLTHGSNGLPACSVMEPKTPAETPPQLSRAFTAEGPNSCRASPQQRGIDASSSARGQAHAAQGMACQGAHMHGGQLGTEAEGRSASAKKQGACSTRKAPKLALRIVPKDTETAEHVEAQGMLAYFELSCRYIPGAAGI